MRFSSRKGVSPLIAAVLLIAFTMAVAAILTAWIAGFTSEHTERTKQFDKKISCAYSNIEVDRDYSKLDSADKVFYAFISNTGVDAISVTRVDVWVDGKKKLPIRLNASNPTLTSIAENEYLEFYINLSKEYTSGSLDKITFITECDPVFDTITKPQGGWNSFDWTTEPLANE